jgi:hypothetical protein
MASNKTRSSGVTRQASPAPPQTPATQQGQTPPQSPPQQTPPINTINPANANQTPNNQNTPLQPGAVTALSQMTDDQLAQLVNDSKNAIMPNHLSDVDDQTQRFVYQAGLNALPTVLDAADFNQFLTDNNIPQSQIIARSVNPISFNAMGVKFNYTAQNVADMMMYSKFNYVGGKVGGQRLGAGTYFDQNGGTNTGYGQLTVAAVLNPATARIISGPQLGVKAAAFMKTHPKFVAAVGPYTTGSQKWTNNNMSIYALAMGYNVIGGSGDYYNVIDRSALVYRK